MAKYKYTEAKKKNNQKWDAENLKRGGFAMPIKLYENFENYCKSKKVSKNGLINELVKERLERDGFVPVQSEEK